MCLFLVVSSLYYIKFHFEDVILEGLKIWKIIGIQSNHHLELLPIDAFCCCSCSKWYENEEICVGDGEDAAVPTG